MKSTPNTSIKAKEGITVHWTFSLAIIFISDFSWSISIIFVSVSRLLSSASFEYFAIPKNSPVSYISICSPDKSHKIIFPLLTQNKPFKSVITWFSLKLIKVVNTSKLFLYLLSTDLNKAKSKGFLSIKLSLIEEKITLSNE